MPLKSKAQLAKFARMVKTGEIDQKTFKEWLNATPNVKALPDKVEQKPKGNGRVRGVRVLK